jgi:hypothetical protein
MVASARDLREHLALARRRLHAEQLGFVLVRDGRVVAESSDPGLAALVDAAELLRRAGGSPAALADRVVGLAALSVAYWGGVRAVYAEVASEAAHRQAKASGLIFACARRVPLITNRTGDGPCPFEAAAYQAVSKGATLDAVAEGIREMFRPHARSAALSSQSGKVQAEVLASAGLGVAAAVLLPLLFHAFGLGPALLPMHLPVLLTGALRGPFAGFAAGLLAPLVSTLLTGMPPLFPVATLMTAELATYGAVGGWLRPRVVRRPEGGRGWASFLLAAGQEWGWLVPTLLAGRLTLGLAATTFGPLVGLRVPAAAYVWGAVVTGLPGLLLQLAVIPALAARVAGSFEQHTRKGGEGWSG